jgi:serine/threonine protein kinase
MANPKQDEVINGYTVKKNALSYAAKDSSGNKVFLKFYKSPKVRVSWYRAYVDYQKELKRRIEANAELNEFCYDMLDFFEEKRRYYQVFGWCKAPDISKILEMVKAGRGPNFKQRCILARRLMGSMTTLHKANIIHADLKPENLLAIKDDSIAAGYKLVLIDMDFSVLSDKKAPWHDDPDTGYIGSPNYYSPEHLRGKAPIPASDVFTCSLILHDLLGASHPYESEEPDDYSDKALNFRAPKPRLEGEIKDAANTSLVADYLKACLNPDPAKRPTAEALRDALNGKAEPIEVDKGEGEGEGEGEEAEAERLQKEAEAKEAERKRQEEEAERVSSLSLEAPTGGSITVRIKTSLGKSTVSKFGEDAQFWSEPQFTLGKNETGAWEVHHDSGAQNETLLNGKAVTGSEAVKDGDELAVGRESKGIIKLPLKVSIG